MQDNDQELIHRFHDDTDRATRITAKEIKLKAYLGVINECYGLFEVKKAVYLLRSLIDQYRIAKKKEVEIKSILNIR